MIDFEKIAEAVVEGDAPGVEALTRKAIDEGQDLEKIIYDGLVKGMDIVAEKWRKFELFIPEVLVSSRAMKVGMGIVIPRLGKELKKIGTFIIGSAKGDIHDIGKNLVSLMLETEGFQVIDLGVNVDKEVFVQSAKDKKAQLVGISALLTTTMPYMKEVIKAFEESGYRDKVKIMVGGAPVNAEYARQIGAEGYAPDAASAVEKAKQLIGSQEPSSLTSEQA